MKRNSSQKKITILPTLRILALAIVLFAQLPTPTSSYTPFNYNVGGTYTCWPHSLEFIFDSETDIIMSCINGATSSRAVIISLDSTMESVTNI